MPLNLNTPEQLNETIDSLEINSFAADLEREEIHVAFDKGRMVNGVFQPIIRDQLVTIGGSDFSPAMAEADAVANQMPVGSISVYGAIKLALYARLQQMTGLSGTVV